MYKYVKAFYNPGQRSFRLSSSFIFLDSLLLALMSMKVNTCRDQNTNNYCMNCCSHSGRIFNDQYFTLDGKEDSC